MADEPNTNPGSGKGEKPAPAEQPKTEETTAASARGTFKTAAQPKPTKRKPAAKRPKSTPAKPAASSSGSAAKRGTKTVDVEETYAKFTADIERLQEDATQRQETLLDALSGDVEKLKSDVEASDPSAAFVKDLTDAVAKSDVTAISEAYATLYRHTTQRQTAAEKRLLDIITGYYTGSAENMADSQKSLIASAAVYSDAVTKTLSQLKVSDLKPQDQTVAAHAMLIDAYLKSIPPEQ